MSYSVSKETLFTNSSYLLLKHLTAILITCLSSKLISYALVFYLWEENNLQADRHICADYKDSIRPSVCAIVALFLCVLK